MSPPGRPNPPTPRDGCLTVLMILAGIIMLLPGVCAGLILGFDLHEVLNDRNTALICFLFFAITAGGIALIWKAMQR